MKFIAIIIAMFLGLTVSYGQTGEISGKVLDKEDNSPIAGVIVQVKDSSDNSYQYTIANDKGEYCIRYNVSVAELLRFQCMGYKSQEINISEIQSNNTIYMVSQPTQLRDVIIKAPDIEQRSDTLSYYMSKYATAEDKKIADVLKRLPGIKVEDNGQIKYNGEPINKFYIDGSDFMDDRYGIATENINPADVASVEVLENHQPMQVLKGLEFSRQAGLNIKLKEEARHRWIAILNGGVGLSPLLYDASAFAMRIAGKWQNMESIRVNNTGWNPASQSTQHIDNDIFGNGYVDKLWDDYINIGISSSPIDESRTRDNCSILANTSNSWHIGESKDMKFNLTYEGDRLDYLTGYETDYFDDDIPSFIERNSMRTQAHRLNGQWALQVNRPTIFLKDNLYIDADWNSARSNVSGTMSLSQKTETPSFSATNDLQLVKRIDNNLLTVSSRNRYSYKPLSLFISGTENAVQDITSGDFRSVTEARYGWVLGRLRVYARGGVDFNYHDSMSSLTGLELPYVMQNDVNFSLLNTYLAPEVSYESYKWKVRLSVPTSYNLHHIRDKKTDGNTTNNYV
ncbi:MAG: carboxypeptidase-like regulatory domain-containing protein, partial [Alistipes sp.]|nr:carboxypeptidase-like regulatory domain-containing protein [Alistipes sp.]